MSRSTADQILVWASVHLSGVRETEENIPRFPALLDTGNNHGFSVQHRHLREWAGIDPGLMESLGDIEINRQVVTLRKATVWLYPNVPGRQDAAVERRPFRLDDGQGNCGLCARCRSSRPAAAVAGPSRPPRQWPRLLDRSGPPACHGAVAYLTQAAHPSPRPIVTWHGMTTAGLLDAPVGIPTLDGRRSGRAITAMLARYPILA